MSEMTLRVPAVLAERFQRVFLSLYGVSADGLHHDVQAHLGYENTVGALRRRREELGALERLVAHFGWDVDAPDRARDVVLAGEGRLVHEAAYGVVVNVAEELELVSRSYVLGETRARDLRELVAELAEVIDLLETTERDLADDSGDDDER